MPKIIIAIHGLGNKPRATLLEKWWLQAIKEGLQKHFGEVPALPEFKMVYWADILNEKPLDENLNNEKDPYYICEPYIPGSGKIILEDHKVRKKILDFINEELNKVFLNEDLSINYSFITDIIINKYFKELDAYYQEECTDENQINCRVKEILRTRLQKLLEQHKRDEILLIGHSMGSIVAYDVLLNLPKEIKIDTFITIGSPLGLPIIKSKIAAELKQNKHGKVKLEVPLAIKNKWYNLSDIEDNIALNYKLSDDFSPNKNEISVFDFEVYNDYIFNNQRNSHKSYGYLRTLEISGIILEFIYRENVSIHKKIIQWVNRLVTSN